MQDSHWGRASFCVPQYDLRRVTVFVRFLDVSNHFLCHLQGVTVCLQVWYVLGVFLLLALTGLGHECQELIHLHEQMLAYSGWALVCTLLQRWRASFSSEQQFKVAETAATAGGVVHPSASQDHHSIVLENKALLFLVQLPHASTHFPSPQGSADSFVYHICAAATARSVTHQHHCWQWRHMSGSGHHGVSYTFLHYCCDVLSIRVSYGSM